MRLSLNINLEFGPPAGGWNPQNISGNSLYLNCSVKKGISYRHIEVGKLFLIHAILRQIRNYEESISIYYRSDSRSSGNRLSLILSARRDHFSEPGINQ
jgi:hypothetical protein